MCLLVKKMTRNFFVFLLLFSATLFVHRFSFQQGIFPSHDGEVHFVRSIHFVEELRRGQFPVRVATDLAHYHSYPVFKFFYPLPYYIVGLLQLGGAETATAWKGVFLLNTLLSSLAIYFLLRRYFDKFTAVLASIVYVLLPFHFVSLYVTGQVGTIFSFLWTPLILLSSVLISKDRNWLGVPILALSTAGLLSSHLLSVILFIPLFFLFFVYNFHISNWNREIVTSTTVGLLIGICLSIWYTLPFIVDLGSIRMNTADLMNFRDHWPTISQLIYSPWGFGHSTGSSHIDGFSLQVGAVFWVCALGLILLVLFKRIAAPLHGLSVITLVAIGMYLLLMQPVSLPIWESIVALEKTQFPWRFLGPLTVLTPIVIGLCVSNFSKKTRILLCTLILVLSFWNVRNYRPWPLDWMTETQVRSQIPAMLGSTDIFRELMPITSTYFPDHTEVEVIKRINQTSATVLRAYRVATTVAELNKNVVHYKNFSKDFPHSELNTTFGADARDIRFYIDLDADNSGSIELNTWSQSHYHVISTIGATKYWTGDTGLLNIQVEPGKNQIAVILTKTPVEKVADAIFILSIPILIVVSNYYKKNEI
jgi:hypothetical protein